MVQGARWRMRTIHIITKVSVNNIIDPPELFSFYDYFAEMQNRSLVSEREFTRLVDRSVDHSLGRKLLFVFPLTNAQLDLTKRKMLSNNNN